MLGPVQLSTACVGMLLCLLPACVPAEMARPDAADWSISQADVDAMAPDGPAAAGDRASMVPPLLRDTLKLRQIVQSLHGHLEEQQEIVMKALDKRVSRQIHITKGLVNRLAAIQNESNANEIAMEKRLKTVETSLGPRLDALARSVDNLAAGVAALQKAETLRAEREEADEERVKELVTRELEGSVETLSSKASDRVSLIEKRMAEQGVKWESYYLTMKGRHDDAESRMHRMEGDIQGHSTAMDGLHKHGSSLRDAGIVIAVIVSLSSLGCALLRQMPRQHDHDL